MVSERAIERRINREMFKLGAYGIKLNPDNEYGSPDRLYCLNGQTILIEVKRPGERPTDIQLSRLDRWDAAGALALWTYNWEYVRGVLIQRGLIDG